MGRLEDNNLGFTVAFKSHGKTIQVRQHGLSLNVYGRIVNCDVKNTVLFLRIECGVGLVIHNDILLFLTKRNIHYFN